MKKILSAILCAVMLLSVLTFVACDKGETPADTTADTTTSTDSALKLGLGVDVVVKASDATEDKNGAGQATVTVAAVLVDEAGKIVKAFIDCADNTVEYTLDGKAVANESFATKYELGDAYNMVAYGGAKQEWYKQADAFCALIVGKTATEVKALVAEDNKGTEDVVNAGCTIFVADFAKAIEKAITNATECGASAADTVKIGVSTAQTTKDASEDADGQNKVETTIFAAAVNAEGKVTAATTDCVDVTFTFGANGASTFDATKPVATKYEQGDAYNMVQYGGAKQEWYKQADAFSAACVGKTAADMAGLAGEAGKGNADLQAAGCTILVDGFIKAVSKIAK